MQWTINKQQERSNSAYNQQVSSNFATCYEQKAVGGLLKLTVNCYERAHTHSLLCTSMSGVMWQGSLMS
jgi:hypothetical protein